MGSAPHSRAKTPRRRLGRVARAGLVACALALAAGLVWLKLAASPERVPTRGPARDAAVAESLGAASDADAAEMERPASSPGRAASEETRSVTPQPAGAQEERAEGLGWVEGIVHLPAERPAEDVRLLARGRRLSRRDERPVRLDSRGAFRASFVPRRGRLELELRSRYLVLEKVPRLRCDELPERVELVAVLGGHVRVRLTLPPSGLPHEGFDASDLKLQLEPTPLGGREFERVEDFTYAIPGISPGSYTLYVDHPEAWVEALEFEVRAGEDLELEAEIRAGVSVSGHVRDASGEPLSGVQVTSPTGLVRNVLSAFRARKRDETDAGGAFELRGIPPGELIVDFSLRGFPPLREELGTALEGDRHTGLRIVLHEGQTLSGRVVMSDGSPAADAELAVLVPSALGWRSRHRLQGLEVDAEGRFRIEGFEDEDSLWLLASRVTVDGAPCLDGVRTRSGASGLVLEPVPGVTATVRVVDETGAPIAKARVRATPMLDELAASSTPHWLARDGEPLDGDPGAYVLHHLQPGAWSVGAQADGCLGTEAVRIDVPGTSRTIVLERGASLSGRVFGREGEPLAGARVTAWVSLEGIAKVEATTDTTDAEGRFELVEVPPGTARVSAVAEGFSRGVLEGVAIPAAGRIEDLELQLQPGGVIEGLVVARERNGRILRLEGPDDEGELGGAAYTPPDGRFRFEGLSAGRHVLRLEPVRDATYESGDTMAVEVLPGEVSYVEIGRASAPTLGVTGTVRAKGAPVPDVHMRMHRAAARGAERVWLRCDTDAAGRFSFQVEEPGQFALLFDFQGSRLQRQIEVVAGAPNHFEFDLPLGEIVGELRCADGSPVPDVTVLLMTTSKEEAGGWKGQRWAESEDDGTFRFDHVQPGTFVVKALGLRSNWRATMVGGDPEPSWYAGTALQEGVEMPATGRLEVDLRMPRAGAVAGKLVGWRDGDRATFVDAKGERAGIRAGQNGAFKVLGAAPGEGELFIDGEPGPRVNVQVGTVVELGDVRVR